MKGISKFLCAETCSVIILQPGTVCALLYIVGFYSSAGQSECTPCSPGTFQPRVGQPTCQPCHHGHICRLFYLISFLLCISVYFIFVCLCVLYVLPLDIVNDNDLAVKTCICNE